MGDTKGRRQGRLKTEKTEWYSNIKAVVRLGSHSKKGDMHNFTATLGAQAGILNTLQ